MNEQPPEPPRGRRRLREPEAATPPPSRPAPRRADPRAAEARRTPSGQHELPPRRGQAPSGEYDLPQPSRRTRREEPPGYDPRRGAPQPGRRRLEPPATLTPADAELDPQERRAAPARAAHARHGLDEGSEIEQPAPRRRRGAPEPDEGPEIEQPAPRRRRGAPKPDEGSEIEQPAPRRRRAGPEPDEAEDGPPRRRAVPQRIEPAPARRRRADPDAAEPPPGRRGPAPEPAEAAGPPVRRRATPDAAEAVDPRRRRAALDPDADPRREPPVRRAVQPGDRSAGVPEPGAEPRRRPPAPPAREEPVTDVLPALAPLPPAEPPRTPPEEPGLLAEDDEYADYDEYDDYDESEYDEEYDDYDEEPRKPRKKGKRALGWVAAIAVIALLAGGAWYGFNRFFGYDDFDGAGTDDVVFQVDDGDTTSAIGAKLTTAGVVASTKAFVKAGEGNPKLARVQHGFYVMKSHMSGASAVDRITDAAARVGQLEIRPYTQFDDITQPDGKVTPGVYSLMAKASCAQLNGKSTCVSADDLRKAVDAADLKQLGVPDWAIEPANKADRKDRRLEGLIAPGLYDVKPGSTAQEMLGQLVHTSAEAIQNAGLSPQATGPGMTPYQTLIIASIIEREAVKADFGKLSRTIYNRLKINMRLQMDSTVNYVLDRPTLLTDEADRAKSGAYNTYRNTGLPPTPIAVPSSDAIKAAVKPPDGEWLFFVKCEKNGLSCFAVSNDEHNRNRDLAKARGVI
ncbi:endolytic transglycosylase MltG [Amycolatopsis sp. DG1A-15b]|uniref:endolytic transglycosylase MltG n=1 Tax=Amycolatopsis sp. DG1A-15b TaxID=3052846 RepID=UPI00255B8E78|nr:endolytic transglycosylase MltG [Amycolatopsis sp. DG1A-15b]WIX89461.1 endolytic transglycosylase MltG [Amycolatopsis sp. DG1A-15b]